MLQYLFFQLFVALHHLYNPAVWLNNIAKKIGCDLDTIIREHGLHDEHILAFLQINDGLRLYLIHMLHKLFRKVNMYHFVPAHYFLPEEIRPVFGFNGNIAIRLEYLDKIYFLQCPHAVYAVVIHDQRRIEQDHLFIFNCGIVYYPL